MTRHVATLTLLDKDAAHRVAAALHDLVDPPPDALTLFEAPVASPGPSVALSVNGTLGRGWRIDAYFADPPDGAALAVLLTDLTGVAVPAFWVEAVPDVNWVALSQAALPPVTAGRFVVHGSHDRHRVPRGPNAILVDAGEAFGTAHHQTTAGCLAAIDRLTRRSRYRNVLDLGCGSGVLAIAVARVLPAAIVLASDMDAPSVLVARENVRRNGVLHRVQVLEACGLAHARLRRAAPFDLVIANILAGPLIRLAPHLGRAVTRGGTLMLSGLLTSQAREIVAVYRAHGFQLDCHDRVDGWSTLTLTRR